MAHGITHSFVSAKAEGRDPTKVRTSAWNDDHVFDLGWYDVQAPTYGAVGDGNADDTTAIQAALDDAASHGGEVFLPPGSYLVTDTLTMGDAAGGPVALRGAGRASVLLVSGALDAAKDVIHVVGSGGALAGADMPYALADFTIKPASGLPGRYGIHLDTTDYPIGYLTLTRVLVYAIGGYSLYTTNGGVSGGCYVTTVEDCVFANGMYLDDVYDSWRVVHNRILGDEYGIYLNAHAGARSFLLQHNSVTAKKGIRVDGGWEVQLLHNYVEGAAGWLGSNSAAIDLNGQASGDHSLDLYTPIVVGNTITPVVDGIHGVRVAACTNAIIHSNAFSRAGAASNDIVTTAAALNSYVGPNYYFPATDLDATVLSDSGTGTCFVRADAATWRASGPMQWGGGSAISSSDAVALLAGATFTGNAGITKDSPIFKLLTASNTVVNLILQRNEGGGGSNVEWNQYIGSGSTEMRWWADSADVLLLDKTGQLYAAKALAVKDGVAAPAAVVGYAKIYVDVADGDLKVVFGDGTVKTIVVDTP